VSKHYRRKYLVDGRYQLSQAAAVILGNVIVAVLVGALLSWFYLLAWDGSVAVNHNRRIPFYITICILVVVALSSYFNLRKSRSIAGMMKKLHTVLDNAGRGEFPATKIVFRKSDYFGQLATPLNECLGQLRKSRSAGGPALIESLQDLADRIEKDKIDNAGVKRSLRKIIRTLEQG
jgi:hypothetical protein